MALSRMLLELLVTTFVPEGTGLVVLMAQRLHPDGLPRQERAWYPKGEATFSDVLGAVRCHLWGAMNYATSPFQAEVCLIPRAVLRRLEQMACYAA